MMLTSGRRRRNGSVQSSAFGLNIIIPVREAALPWKRCHDVMRSSSIARAVPITAAEAAFQCQTGDICTS